jgi:hypothetical protein
MQSLYEVTVKRSLVGGEVRKCSAGRGRFDDPLVGVGEKSVGVHEHRPDGFETTSKPVEDVEAVGVGGITTW